MFIMTLTTDPGVYLMWVTVIAFSICCHEFAHAWVACREGDSTAVEQGYLTMNPLRVMGMQSLVFLALFGIAWGSVPVRPAAMRRRHSHLLVAMAGPVMNLILAGAGVAVCAIMIRTASALAGLAANPVFDMFLTIGTANFFLFMFNLLPVPVFDGWELYRSLFPALRRVPPQQAQQWGFGLLLVILLTGAYGYIWRFASFLTAVLMG